MKRVLLLCLLVGACAAVAQIAPPPTNATVFSNLDDSPNGWGSCTNCAGGTLAGTFWMAQYQTTPSVDGDSTQFYLSGSSWTDVLWWNKLGAHNSFTNFQTDFWIMFGSDAVANAQALEFDTFHFVKGREFMFGTQCDYAYNAWDVWNQQAGQWIKTSIPCGKFTANVWYHIIWQFHRGSTPKDKTMHYDALNIVQYAKDGVTVVSNQTYQVNLAYPSGPLPTGWSDDLGVQFQMDSNANGGTMTEWVDRVKLSAW